MNKRKSIIVIDEPSSCKECAIRFDDEYSYWCPCVRPNPEPNGIYEYFKNETKPNWCPLKPVPEFKLSEVPFEVDYMSYSRGFDEAVYKILGG